jgi:hypothetical protein
VAGRKTFIAGEILTASDVNGFLMDQSVMVFDDATARTAAIPSPTEGMVTYRKDENSVEVFDGSSFGPIGKILQVVSAIKTNTFTTTSNSFVDVTGLSVAITPSSTSSKILVLAQISHGWGNDGTMGIYKVVGGNTATYVGDASSTRPRSVFGGYSNSNNNGAMTSGSIIYLDSPNSTSAQTYKVQATNGLGASIAYLNRSADDSNDNRARGASSITVMEVAG